MVLCKNCKTGALAVRSLCNDGQGLFILPSFPPSVIPAFRHSRLPSFPALVIPALPALPSVLPRSGIPVFRHFRHSRLPAFPSSGIPVFRHSRLPAFPLSRECESIQSCHMTNSRWQGCMDSRSPTGVRDKLRGNDGLLSRIHYWFRRLIKVTRQVASALNREWRLLRHAHHGNMQELQNRGPSSPKSL